MLTQKQIDALTHQVIEEHRSGQNPLQLIRHKWNAMTPEQKADHERAATASAIEHEKQRRADAGET